MNKPYLTVRNKLGLALVGSSFASIGLYIFGNRSHDFSYLPWNLFLAWIALLSTLWLEKVLKRTYWSSWEALLWSAVWLFLLPNTFYMVSDFVHLRTVANSDLLYDVAMFSSFIFNAFMLGLLSLFIVHWQLAKRISSRAAFIIIQGILLACSFGIYIGRELRWNTWDIVTNFSSVIFDISDRILNLSGHPQTIPTTVSFFVLLSSTYLVFWNMARIARLHKEG